METMRFGDLDIVFDDRVLEPRPWTLAQSQWSAELLGAGPPGAVLELFAGVGHIGLATVTPTARDLVLVDLNPAACDLARRNVAAAGLAGRVDVREGRIDEVVGPDERFCLIIADPPWVPSAGIAEFPGDPSIAIDGGSDGLDLARTACAVIDRHLVVGGSAVLQLGTEDQVAAVDTHLRDDLGSALQVAEVRTFDRGVLVHLLR